MRTESSGMFSCSWQHLRWVLRVGTEVGSGSRRLEQWSSPGLDGRNCLRQKVWAIKDTWAVVGPELLAEENRCSSDKYWYQGSCLFPEQKILGSQVRMLRKHKLHYDSFSQRFYLFIFRERRREEEREGENHQRERGTSTCCLSNMPRLGTKPATQACALARWPFALRDDAQPTEPHWSGHSSTMILKDLFISGEWLEAQYLWSILESNSW